MTSLRLCELECDVEYGKGECSSSNTNRASMSLRLVLSWPRALLLGWYPFASGANCAIAFQKSINQRSQRRE